MGLEAPNRLPDAVRDVLADADRFELLSLDPDSGPTREAGHFWGWRVLGSAVVDTQAARDVLAALERGIAENEGWVAACFDPRHGICASRGADAVDLVVCFECAQVYLYPAGKRMSSVRVTGSPEPVFDRVLREAGVALAPKRAEPGVAPGPRRP